MRVRWHGSVHANGRIRRRLGRSDDPGRWSVGGRQLVHRQGEHSYLYEPWDLHPRQRQRRGLRRSSPAASRRSALTAPALSPRIAEPTPSSAEGSMLGTPAELHGSSITTPTAPSCSAGMAANKNPSRLLWQRRRDLQPQRRALDRRSLPILASGGMEILGVAGTGIFNQTGGTNVCTTQLDVGGSHYGLLFHTS